jgi:LacI family transcriptional regulator
MQRARELLAETEMSLPRIAHAAGFRHQAHFGLVFKSETGMTPGEFRQENAIAQGAQATPTDASDVLRGRRSS